jgi:glycosyltransferase involved in cell wall biosynthesis
MRTTETQGSTPEYQPCVSVVVCTRNRGESIASTVRTLLDNTYLCFELIIIDQSTNESTAEAVAPFLGDKRLRYLRSATSGLSVARNLGLADAQHEIVLMTDDDCDAPTDWIAKMVAAFQRYPQVACVFCDVAQGPFDSAKGFIPYCIHEKESLVTHISKYEPGVGIGAGMGLRRPVAQQIGGFDPLLGAGMELASGEEVDLVLRLLLNGYHVYHTKSTSVVHHGFRTYEEGRKLTRSYMYGSSALYAKLIKCGHWSVLPLFLQVIWISVFVVIWDNLRRGKIPPVLGRIEYLFKGFIRGCHMPVNQKAGTFRDPIRSDHIWT